MGLRTPGQQPGTQTRPKPPAGAAPAKPGTAPAGDPNPQHGDPYPEEQEEDPAAAGGPGSEDPAETEDPAEDPAAAADPAPAEQEPAESDGPIEFNGMSFRDAQELAIYTQALQQGLAAGQKPGQKQDQPILIDGKPLEQVLYNEPERYHQWMLEQATNAAVERLGKVTAQERAEQNYWTEFYNKNPDLKQFEFIVKSKFQQTWTQIEKMKVPASMAFLAKEARAEVDNVRKASGITTTELPSGGARTLGASGAPAPRVPQTPAKPKTFVDQLRDARRKRA